MALNYFWMKATIEKQIKKIITTKLKSSSSNNNNNNTHTLNLIHGININHQGISHPYVEKQQQIKDKNNNK